MWISFTSAHANFMVSHIILLHNFNDFYGGTSYLFILNSCNKHLKLPLQTRLELTSHVLRQYVLEYIDTERD